MCLYRITKRFDKPERKERKGFKVMQFGDNGHLITPFTYTRIKQGKWMRARKCNIETISWARGDYRYKSGFHVYARRRDAEFLLSKLGGRNGLDVAEVIVRQTETLGMCGAAGESKMRVFVAREMMIPKRRARGVAKGCGA